MTVTAAQFTDPAQVVLLAAAAEARRGGQPYLGSAHLLLGLAYQGVTARTLVALGAPLPVLRAEVTLVCRGGTAPVVPASSAPVLTPSVRGVLERAVAEATRQGHAAAGPEHLLLALVEQGQGFAAQVLARLGLAPADVRATLLQLLEREG